MATANIKEVCQICKTEKFKYSCPKCNILYCSVACYKSEAHQKCSEQFYKHCVEEELLVSAAAQSTNNDVKEIYEILKRINEADANDIDGFNCNNLQAELEGRQVDSDDDGAVEDEEEDIASRLQEIDMNDSDKVWQKLSPKEREEFQKMIESGDIMGLLPSYEPWWCICSNQKIVVISEKSREQKQQKEMPQISSNILKFRTIYRKTPPPCLHYNLWNILTAYTCTVRFFNGEHQTIAIEAASHLVNVSANLKCNTNFDDAEQAITSVALESICGSCSVDSEIRSQMQNDVRQLMTVQSYKLAALSDVLTLFRLAKEQIKQKTKRESEFSKQFGIRTGSIELNKSKLNQLMKKMEFFLAYVWRDEDDHDDGIQNETVNCE